MVAASCETALSSAAVMTSVSITTTAETTNSVDESSNSTGEWIEGSSSLSRMWLLNGNGSKRWSSHHPSCLYKKHSHCVWRLLGRQDSLIAFTRWYNLNCHTLLHLLLLLRSYTRFRYDHSMTDVGAITKFFANVDVLIDKMLKFEIVDHHRVI